MLRAAPFDLPFIMLSTLAVVFALIAYWKDPGLPFMGWRFVMIRVVPSLAFPIIAGLLVKLYYHE